VNSGAFALIAGIVYTLLGIAGLFPAASGYLGLFPMNVPLGALHLVVGVCGLAAASVQRYGRVYARGVAAILGLLGAMGLTAGLDSAFGLMPLHGHNVWLHLGTAAIAAYLGWRPQIPVLREEHPAQDRRDGIGDRRETITTVSREHRHGAYDRRTPLGA
jgi:uncharacterized membrane protein YfcA